jgi:coenzyme PQQ synthesis protein D (PqqD)
MYRSWHTRGHPDAAPRPGALTWPDGLPNLRLGTNDFMKWQLNPQVVARRLGAASVLVNLDSNAIYELNVTGARVIDLLASGVDDLALPHQLRAEFDDVGESVQSDVRRLLEDLRMAGLILPVHG